MGKIKAGLHKDISAIFDGVPLPVRNHSDSPKRSAIETRPRKTPHLATAKPLSSAGQNMPSKVDYNKTRPQPGKHLKLAVESPEADDIVSSESLFHRLQTWTKAKLTGGSFSYRKAFEAVALGGLLIFFAVRVFAIVGPSPISASQQPLAEEQLDKPFDGNVDWQFPEPYSAELRDPMMLATITTLAKTEPDALEVKGVLHSKDNSFAIIGIEIAKIGDVVSGATIMKIEDNSVTFKKDEKVWTQPIRK